MFGMGSGNRVHVAVTGDKTDLKAALDGADRDTKGFVASSKRTWSKWSDEIKTAFAVKAAGAIKDLVVSSTQAAVALSESQNAVQKVFGESADVIENFGDVSAEMVGLSKREFQELSTITGALLKNMGLSADEAAVATVRLGTRAADMASVFNKDVATALEAVNSGLKGEANPLEQFGVKLNAAAVEAKALEMGLADSKAGIDDNAKALATMQLIMEQTDNTAGDFIQTSGDLANAGRIAAAEWENAKAGFGQTFLPLAAKGLNIFTRGWQEFGAALKTDGQEGRKQVLAVSKAVENLSNAIKEGKDAPTALADGLLHIAEEGDLTRQQFEALAAAAGLLPDQFEAFTDVVLTQAEAAGVDADVLAELEAALRGTVKPTDDAAEATENLAEKERAQKAATDAAREAIEKKAEALRQVHDPLFRLVKLNDDLETAEKEVEKAARKGVGSEEYKQAIIDQANILADVNDVMRDLREDGIDPTGEAARTMLEGLRIPPGVIDQIFADFDAMQREFESRQITIGWAVDAGVGPDRPQQFFQRPSPGDLGFFGSDSADQWRTPDASLRQAGATNNVTINNTFHVTEVTAAKETARKIRDEIDRMRREIII